MRIVGAVVAVSLVLAGCFPHNARYRTYSKWAEAGSLVAGIALAAAVNTGADCDTQGMAAENESSCKSTAATCKARPMFSTRWERCPKGKTL